MPIRSASKYRPHDSASPPRSGTGKRVWGPVVAGAAATGLAKFQSSASRSIPNGTARGVLSSSQPIREALIRQLESRQQD
jgi:hypothetical protein